MIFSYQVKSISTIWLRRALRDLPAGPRLLDIITNGGRWNKWVELCTDRCNQLDLAGYVRSKAAMLKFIEDAAVEYAIQECKRMGERIDGGKGPGVA